MPQEAQARLKPPVLPGRPSDEVAETAQEVLALGWQHNSFLPGRRRNHLFEAPDGLDVRLRGGETGVHRVHAKMCGPQLLPGCNRARPVVRRAPHYADARLDANV